jgi:probable HAF family extracellular repeat protein
VTSRSPHRNFGRIKVEPNYAAARCSILLIARKAGAVMRFNSDLSMQGELHYDAKRRTIRVVQAVIIGAAMSVTSAARAASGDIYNLGTLGGEQSRSFGINAAGQVTGYSNSEDNTNHAFRFTRNSGSGGILADLHAPDDYDSYGYAINDAGQVTGARSMMIGPSYYERAFLYSGTPGSDGAMADLGTLGGSDSYGRGINAFGQVAGTSFTLYNTIPRAFLYSGTPGNGGAMVDLGTLGGSDSHGSAINDVGQITGWSVTTEGVTHAFLYSGAPGNGGAMVDLGTLGGTRSRGLAINEAGQVTGYSRTIDGDEHAFLYTGTPGVDGQMIDLDPYNDGRSYGYTINAAGQIAGERRDSYGYTYAFLDTGTPGVDGRMIDLDVWLNSVNPTEGAKWSLYEARGLTDTGLITGIGTYNDGPGGLDDGVRAFLLDAGTLSVKLAGDYNLNGIVDAADYTVWRNTLGSSTRLAADGDGNGMIDAGDYNLFSANFGASINGGASIVHAVPEPAGIWFTCVGVTWFMVSIRRSALLVALFSS